MHIFNSNAESYTRNTTVSMPQNIKMLFELKMQYFMSRERNKEIRLARLQYRVPNADSKTLQKEWYQLIDRKQRYPEAYIGTVMYKGKRRGSHWWLALPSSLEYATRYSLSCLLTNFISFRKTSYFCVCNNANSCLILPVTLPGPKMRCFSVKQYHDCFEHCHSYISCVFTLVLVIRVL
jgi:hypothetical protein